MSSLNLNDLDPAELLPTPEVPENYGPRNDEEVHVYALVKKALDEGAGTNYESVEDLIAELRAEIPRTTSQGCSS